MISVDLGPFVEDLERLVREFAKMTDTGELRERMRAAGFSVKEDPINHRKPHVRIAGRCAMFPGSDDQWYYTPSAVRSALVCQALGAASICWERPDRAGVFDSTKARQIADQLLADLREVDKPR
jgi:hypothetical protein